MAVTASADAFKYLQFRLVNSEIRVVAAQNLEISIADGKLVASSPDNTEPLTLTLAELASMEFTNVDESGITDAVVSTDGAVSAFALDGTAFGRFASLDEAYKSLDPGVYVIQATDGSTFKLMIAK